MAESNDYLKLIKFPSLIESLIVNQLKAVKKATEKGIY